MAADIFFDLSVRSVRRHFLRSLLAAVGIVIGVVAITSMGIMGTSMSLSVTDSLTETGNVLVIYPDSGGDGGGKMGGPSGGDEDEYISENQVRDIVRAAGSNEVVPIYSETEQIRAGSEERRATIYGLDTDQLPDLFEVAEGDYPRSTSGVLVGPTLAENLDLKVGTRIKIGDPDDEGQHTVRVNGILEERGMSMDLNTDNAVIASDRWFTSVFGGEGEYDQVNVVVGAIEDIDQVKDDIDRHLNKKDDEVRIWDSGQMLESITSTLDTMTGFIMAIGGISLLVAAVSIFNVMMMSVTERTREIGILRSIGTRRTIVRRMFLYEAFILGGVGAVIGGVLSLVAGYLAVLVMIGDAAYFFTPEALIYVPYGMCIGVAVCVFSGLYPAWKAADLDPVMALAAE
ncbi:ABC transporter permease [Methanofollis formosanus]|uniref:ABC transporter permease n=1 Tax=Methanofollis formosanus TaxID=299308 RepID=A0A8G0ZXA4_9EURY|nr:ABC transporter permease [Methanofollis formosanus]QYZ78289.1 ABC transporter permease [Methanofollis formosanus]